MKVSEAVERLTDASVSGMQNYVMVRREDLQAVVVSHEALRLAGENLVCTCTGRCENFEWMPADNSRCATRALSLAVEDASK